MKRVIFMIALLSITIGCIDKKEDDDKKKKDYDWESLIDKQKQKQFAGCTNIIVIDLTKIPSANRTDWKDENKDYFCTRTLSTPTQPACFEADNTCSQNANDIVIVDLDLIKDTVTPNPSEEDHNYARAAWLTKNGEFICYPKTYPYLIDAHAITEVGMQTAMMAEDHYDITFAEMIKQIEDKAGAGYFAKDEYKKWVLFSVSKGNVVAMPTSHFSNKFACVSIPFLRAVMRNFCPDDTLKIEVYPFTYKGEYLMGLRIFSNNAAKPIYLFNYSDDPKILN